VTKIESSNGEIIAPQKNDSAPQKNHMTMRSRKVSAIACRNEYRHNTAQRILNNIRDTNERILNAYERNPHARKRKKSPDARKRKKSKSPDHMRENERRIQINEIRI